MKKGTLKQWIALITSAVLAISLFAIPAFAADSTSDSGKGGLSTEAIVWIVTGAVVLVAAVVLGIIFREKIRKYFRVLKSESKKIVWLPWDQTKKSTLMVIVVLVICALAICLLDYGLSKGIFAVIDIFESIKAK